jgi:hypothetical protein
MNDDAVIPPHAWYEIAGIIVALTWVVMAILLGYGWAVLNFQGREAPK